MGASWQKSIRWAGILASYFTSQGLVQLTSVLAGLLFVNFLPVGEFALYTLAASVLAFFTFVTDLGSTSSLLYFFHRTRQEGREDEFTEYVAAVQGLRRIAFFAGGAFVAISLPWAAREQGFGWPGILLATAAVLLTASFQIDAAIRVLSLRLRDHYAQSYRAEVLGALARLVAAGLIIAAGWRVAGLGVATAALASGVTAWRAATVGGAVPPPSPARRREVLRYLLPTLPSALYFSIQGPLIVWLAACFGGTRQIAEVGALGRLGLVVSLFSGLTAVVFLPRLARLSEDRLYLMRYVQFGLALAVLAGGLVTLSALLPSWFLLLVGGQYAGLNRELVLIVASAGVALLDGYAVSVNNARSWTRWQAGALSVLALSQVWLAATCALHTTAGVLLFGLLSRAVALGSQLTIAVAGFLRPRWVLWNPAAGRAAA
jgi:O-antigen/teichoic acid export membrane protein